MSEVYRWRILIHASGQEYVFFVPEEEAVSKREIYQDYLTGYGSFTNATTSRSSPVPPPPYFTFQEETEVILIPFHVIGYIRFQTGPETVKEDS